MLEVAIQDRPWYNYKMGVVIKKLAFVVENEVFDIFEPIIDEKYIDEFNYDLSNNPIGMDITNFPFANRGWVWTGETFVKGPTVVPGSYDDTNVRPSDIKIAYAFLSNNKIFFLAYIKIDIPKVEMYKAAFASSPTVIDISNIENVNIGDIWDGQNFISGAA